MTFKIIIHQKKRLVGVLLQHQINTETAKSLEQIKHFLFYITEFLLVLPVI